MKLLYIANIRLPTERAHGLQIMKMCEAFSREGMEVTLLVPNRKNRFSKDPFDFYSVSRIFSIQKIDVPNLMRFGALGFILSSWFFAFLAVKEALKRGFDTAYSREGNALWLLSWLRKDMKFVWEVHDDQRKWWAKRVLVRCAELVVTNHALAALHVNFAGKEVRFLVAPNGMTFSEYLYDKDKLDIRRELGIQKEDKIVLYTGHLYAYKGGDVLMQAAKFLPKFKFIFIGGTPEDIEKLRKNNQKLKNIKNINHILHEKIALYLRAADFLVIPNTANSEFSSLYTSPIKLFEYLASNTPIVASDLPSIREIVDDQEVFFFTPDNPQDLAEKISYADTHSEISKQKANASLEKSKQFTWENRAKRIINSLKI